MKIFHFQNRLFLAPIHLLSRANNLNTGCCTTFCKGGKPWFRTSLWLKIHSNNWEIYQRTQMINIYFNLIWFRPSRRFFGSAHLEKFQVFFVLFCDSYLNLCLHNQMFLKIIFCYSWIICWFWRWNELLII